MDPIFQFPDLSTHVQNCSNDECILPTCVNWKLKIAKNCRKQPQQHKKREWSTIVSDARNKKKLRHDKELDVATALFFEDLEELMKGDLGKRCPSCLATETNAKNSFHVSQSNPRCNQLHIAVDNDVNLTLNSQQTTATTEATEKLQIFCSLKDYKLPHEDESKLKKQGSIIQPTNAKRLLGILAQILQIIEEGSVSEDSEAFCVEILQKALAELQVRFYPPKWKKKKKKKS